MVHSSIQYMAFCKCNYSIKIKWKSSKWIAFNYPKCTILLYHVDLGISLSAHWTISREVNVMICVCMRQNSTFGEFSNWSIITFVAYSSYAILTWHIYTEWWQSKIIPIIPLDLWINAFSIWMVTLMPFKCIRETTFKQFCYQNFDPFSVRWESMRISSIVSNESNIECFVHALSFILSHPFSLYLITISKL